MAENRTTMRETVQLIFGTAINTTINKGLVDGCDRLQRMHNFRFMEASTTMTVLEGDTTFSLPSDFKCEMNPEISDTDQQGYRRIKKIIKNGIESRDTTESGRPLKYRIWNNIGNLYAQADDEYGFPMEYYKYLPELTDAITDSDLQNFVDAFHEAIEYYAKARCSERLHKFDDAQLWDDRFLRKAFEYILEDEEIALANADLIMEMPG